MGAKRDDTNILSAGSGVSGPVESNERARAGIEGVEDVKD